MDPAVSDIVKSRIKPMVDEVFDGYVIMGYHTDSQGVRQRIILHNTGARNVVQVGEERKDLGPKDCALFDAMEVPVAMARQWAGGGVIRQ